MNIPLDRLYHYIENTAREMQDDVLIYRFFPHGHKKISDLRSLQAETFYTYACGPGVYCNDQEILDFDYYRLESDNERDLMTKYQLTFDLNFRFPFNIFDQCVLLHSEQGGSNLRRYTANGNYVPAYYWSHAVIARDWYRYAEHVNFSKSAKRVFLIYNRAWTGTREYRNKFADLLVDFDLTDFCQTTFNVVDPESQTHYGNYSFKNSFWKPKNKLENYFVQNHSSSDSSADFDIEDYNSAHIEIVLETLFDDDRIHLTEKTLRPIACAQPFVVASTSGCLQYLRSYGFKTFHTVWDESYDLETNPQERLVKIVQLMQQISQWDQNTLSSKLQQANQIALYNKKHFFSKEFFDKVTGELKHNLHSALNQVVSTNTSSHFLNRYTQWFAVPEMQQRFETKYGKAELEKVLQKTLQIQQHNRVQTAKPM